MPASRYSTLVSLLAISLIIFSSCSDQHSEPSSPDTPTNNLLTLRDFYANPDILADPPWLKQHLEDDNLVLVDIREDSETKGYIPGAVSLDGILPLLDGDHEVESFLIGAEKFAELMSGLGITSDSRVVIYDEGTNLYAARLFYALDLYGHENMMLLNGGYRGWVEAGGAVVNEPSIPQRSIFRPRTNEAVFCDLASIQAAKTHDHIVIFDVRSEDQYRGEWVRAQQGGHIPGAVNLVWNATIHDPDTGPSWFLPPENIEAMYRDAGITPEKEVIPHCHTNLHGSHAYFVLRLMGYESVRAYEGSWAEYGNVHGLPVSR